MDPQEEEALVAPIAEAVGSLLNGMLASDVDAVATRLAPRGPVSMGLALFGLDAVSVALGFATKPQQLGLSAVEVGDGAAVAEIRGRDEADQDVSVASLFLSTEYDGTWRVEDIWPVAADGALDVELIAEPTARFYTGQLQLTPLPDAAEDEVERLLLPGLQDDGMGLHLIEQGMRLWRTYRAEVDSLPPPPGGWAAGVHLAVLALEDAGPDPEALADRYGVPIEAVIACFMQLANALGFADQEEEQPEPMPPSAGSASGLVDLSGNPLSSNRRRDEPAGGIILPHG